MNNTPPLKEIRRQYKSACYVTAVKNHIYEYVFLWKPGAKVITKTERAKRRIEDVRTPCESCPSKKYPSLVDDVGRWYWIELSVHVMKFFAVSNFPPELRDDVQDKPIGERVTTFVRDVLKETWYDKDEQAVAESVTLSDWLVVRIFWRLVQPKSSKFACFIFQDVQGNTFITNRCIISRMLPCCHLKPDLYGAFPKVAPDKAVLLEYF